MKIGVAQIQSLKGEVNKNIEKHLQMIDLVVKSKVDLIVFPELSITNYEPDLAYQLSTDIDDTIFDVFQKKSNNNNITIAIGMPTKSTEGIRITMLIFQPYQDRTSYSKQLLHVDEMPYFVCGKASFLLSMKHQKIGFGICFESLQQSHFLSAKQNGIDIYIASVAKPQSGIEKAYPYFSQIAAAYNTPILMSNSIGDSDNFLSAGQSAVWDDKGILVDQFNHQHQGVLIYDTALNSVEKKYFNLEIVKVNQSDLEILFQIYENAKQELRRNNIFQWTENYPTKSIIENDIKKGGLYILKKESEIVGAININEEQDEEYQTINWKFDDTKVLVIHRLVVDPKHQKNGYAKLLMNFAETYAQTHNYTSIRLDAYSHNVAIVDFYSKRNYHIRGDVFFPERKFPFHCFEKELKGSL